MIDVQAIKNALNEARGVLRSADEIAEHAIHFAAGRLRRLGLDRETLQILKRELQGFDAKRGKWNV